MKFFKPEVRSCTVEKCSFNKNNSCHALIISVGGPHQECDTYDSTCNKSHHETGTTSVGECHVPGCSFNLKNLCQADMIDIATHKDHADCVSFKEKQ